MSKNLITVGDSFCEYKKFWPQTVADELNLNLLHFGHRGIHWWPIKRWIDNLSQSEIDNTEVIIFCHTYSGRIPLEVTKNMVFLKKLNKRFNFFKKLYDKHFHNENYCQWVESKWFEEISEKFSNVKIINLHCFYSSYVNKNYLKGINVYPSLTSLSLNELDVDIEFVAMHDYRPNHFTEENNKVLAEQLVEIIKNYSEQDMQLDTKKFNLKTTKWFGIV